MLLVAVDIEGAAPVVVREAAALARDLGEPTLLVTVVQHPEGVTWDAHVSDGRTVAQVLEADAEAALQDLAETFESPVETVVLRGTPVDAVLGAARERGPRMIVVGTHARQGLARLVLGSVAEQILRQSAVPVVVVPARDAAFTRSEARRAMDAEADG